MKSSVAALLQELSGMKLEENKLKRDHESHKQILANKMNIFQNVLFSRITTSVKTFIDVATLQETLPSSKENTVHLLRRKRIRLQILSRDIQGK